MKKIQITSGEGDFFDSHCKPFISAGNCRQWYWQWWKLIKSATWYLFMSY